MLLCESTTNLVAKDNAKINRSIKELIKEYYGMRIFVKDGLLKIIESIERNLKAGNWISISEGKKRLW